MVRFRIYILGPPLQEIEAIEDMSVLFLGKYFECARTEFEHVDVVKELPYRSWWMASTMDGNYRCKSSGMKGMDIYSIDFDWSARHEAVPSFSIGVSDRGRQGVNARF